MANYDSLINAVKAAVKTNGTGAITGATLQATLLGTIEELTVGFQFMGVATPETTPDSNDKKEFYLGFAGTYANFGSSVTVPEGSVILFKKNEGAWSSQVVKIAEPVSVSQNTLMIGDTPVFDIKYNVHNGSISDDGSISSTDKRIYTSEVLNGHLKISCPDDYQIFIVAYYDKNGTFIKKGRTSSPYTNIYYTESFDDITYIRVVIRKPDNSSIAPGEADVKFENLDADKQYVGNAIDNVAKLLEKDNALNPNNIIAGYGINSDGTISAKSAWDIYVYNNISNEKQYRFSGKVGAAVSLYMVSYWDSTDTLIGFEQATRNLSSTEAYQVNDLLLTIPEDCATIKVNVSHSYQSLTALKRVVGFYNFDSWATQLNDKLTIVTKAGTNIYCRSHYDATRDVVILFAENADGHNMCPKAVYLGPSVLDTLDLAALTYRIRDIGDCVGALGVSTVWYLYAQHGWQVPRVQMASVSVDSTDIGSIWSDEKGNRYVLGNIQGNYVFMLPEVTLVNGIYKASWDNQKYYPAWYPSQFTHVSGATHTATISGTMSYPQLRIQTAVTRKFLADGVEIISDGTYICNEFTIYEHILGHNPAFVSYNPSFTYGDSLIDWDRSFTIIGSSVTCDTTINTVHDFIVTDYRGVIPIMPLKIGDFNSYTFIPKVKKEQNSHRIDLPFETNDGTEYVTATRNATDLHDVDKQPERCINYLKDDNELYLIGSAGGGSLIRGLSRDSEHNILVPVNQNTMTYGGSSTPNKFYPKLIQAAGFDGGVVPSSFIKNFTCYYCWFNPNENNGQVYWYKDGDKFIVYIHCQETISKMPVNLPNFMNGKTVTEVVEKTEGASLLTEKVGSSRLYVSFDASEDAANYIVIALQ